MKGKSKKILFVLPTAQIGGTRTALLNLLSNMDKEAYEIDLLVMLHRGEMIKQFKSLCNLLPQDEILLAGRESRGDLLKKRKIFAFFRQITLSVWAKKQGLSRYDLAYRLAAKKYSGRYDCVIAFQEKDATEFAQYIEAPRKIAWVHSKYYGNAEVLSKVYASFQKNVFVSDGIMNEYIANGATEVGRSVRIYNCYDQAKINELCVEYEAARHRQGCPLLVSVGRCAKEKGFDRIIETAVRLKKEKVDFEWIVVGGGVLLDHFLKEVQQHDLQDYLFFVGYKNNPYPYINMADFVVVSSTTESFSLVCVEAASLKKPVVVTDYPAAHEVVKNEKTGIICPNSTDGVYGGVKRMIFDTALKNSITKHLENFSYDNDEIMEQVYSVIESE